MGVVMERLRNYRERRRELKQKYGTPYKALRTFGLLRIGFNPWVTWGDIGRIEKARDADKGSG